MDFILVAVISLGAIGLIAAVRRCLHVKNINQFLFTFRCIAMPFHTTSRTGRSLYDSHPHVRTFNVFHNTTMFDYIGHFCKLYITKLRQMYDFNWILRSIK